MIMFMVVPRRRRIQFMMIVLLRLSKRSSMAITQLFLLMARYSSVFDYHSVNWFGWFFIFVIFFGS